MLDQKIAPHFPPAAQSGAFIKWAFHKYRVCTACLRHLDFLCQELQLTELVDYILFDPFDRSLKGGSNIVIGPSPRSMADALQLPAKVTDGREKQTTVIGGTIIMWFAAAAEWLLYPRVSIYTPDGVRLSANHVDQTSQLLLI